jgi:hypothetical protein
VSIWTSVAEISPIYDVEYALNADDVIAGGSIGLADSRGWYGQDALRLSIYTATSATDIVIARQQLIELRDALTAWLTP